MHTRKRKRKQKNPLNNRMFLPEDVNRLGTALSPDDLPEPYNTYPVIDVGSTSVILEDPADPDFVYAITRDQAKLRWLTEQWGIGIGETIDIFKPEKPHIIEDVNNMDAYVIRMPRFIKITPEEERKLMQTLSHVLKGRTEEEQRRTSVMMATVEHDPRVKKFLNSFTHFFDFLPNLNGDYRLDIQPKNIMKSMDGDYVLLDPVMDGALHDALVGQAMRDAVGSEPNFSEEDPKGYKWS